MKRVLAFLLALIMLVSWTALAEGNWVCPGCGRENEPDFAFCPADGTGKPATSWVCPKCGRENKPDFAFCPADGTAKPVGMTTTSVSVQTGDIITFGSYPQTATGKDSTPIEWQVLEVQGNKALLISKYGLDAVPYNTKDLTYVTWETCTLRTWLNNEFLNKAFSATERKQILTTTVDNSKSQGYSDWDTKGGNNTQDKIFLLSYAEANKYFGVTRDNNNNTASRVAPTAYAIAQGAYTAVDFVFDYKTADGADTGWWWLRSPGYRQFSAAYVYIDGSLRSSYVRVTDGAIRPAFWLDLESVIF